MGQDVGRPPSAMVKIDKKKLESIMALYPGRKEASDFFEVSPTTLDLYIKNEYNCTFTEFRDQKWVKTKLSIKQKQIQVAIEKESVPMLIWVGKQYLGQSDKTQISAMTESDEIVDDGDVYEFIRMKPDETNQNNITSFVPEIDDGKDSD